MGTSNPPNPAWVCSPAVHEVPVVPARIFGSFDAFGRDGKVHIPTPVTVVYGKPISPTDYDDPSAGKERYLRASERIMTYIAALEKPRETIV
ncbi:MAG: hypothetical protein QM760_14365 [Nibricoccus sp.]